ncbi:MAG: cell division protein FtsQ/DivIB [Pseudomonadota bacterium]|nr:cell division protein FtsQ/DivIB [Pseudomonadota bacterium]
MKKNSRKKYLNLGKPRRRVVSFWRHRHFRLALALILFLFASHAGWQVWQTGWIPNTLEKAKWTAIKASTELGFQVNEILVTGRNETDQESLLNAIRLTRGAPILAFDIKAAQKRIENLQWVKKVTVKRMLPDTLLLNVEEHEPLALWQHNGVFSLIGTDGEVILQDNLNRFSDLVVVVGLDAPKHTLDLLKALRLEPELMQMVKAAVRVGGRRWNLRLDGGIDVRLPEKNAADAWTRLAEYEKSHQVLKRKIKTLDLRLPDRLIVRESPVSTSDPMGKRQET